MHMVASMVMSVAHDASFLDRRSFCVASKQWSLPRAHLQRKLMRNEALADELLAIEAIFPGAVQQVAGSDSTYVVRVDRPTTGCLSIEFYLGFDHLYPATRPTVTGISLLGRGHVWSPPDARQHIDSVLKQNDSQEVLFALLSFLQEQLESEEIPREVGQVRDESRSSAATTQWFVGEPIHDRKSIHLGRACRVNTVTDLEAALESVSQDKDLQKATHPCIWACRYPSPAESLQFITEHDDDGETAAGSRLAHLLEVTQAQNVLVVVSRWFGGINLGPRRFHDISTAGRNALEYGGFLRRNVDHATKPAH